MNAKTRALALLAGGTFIVSAAPPPEIDIAPVPMFTYMRQVKQIFCGRSRGTAFYTGTNALTSANHVTKGNNCGTADELIDVTFASAEQDYSFSRIATTEPHPLAVDCRGFQGGREYQAVGFAHGAPVQRTVVVSKVAEVLPWLKWGDSTVLIGRERLIPGMSGGPVIDAETGEVVGIVRGYNEAPGISYAVELKGTPLCQGSVAQ